MFAIIVSRNKEKESIMRNIVEYALIVKRLDSITKTLDAVRNEVNKSIEKGWQPQGGACITSNDTVAQTLVKYEESL